MSTAILKMAKFCYWPMAKLVPARFSELAAQRRYLSKDEMFRKRLVAEEIGRKFEPSDDALIDVMKRMTKAVTAGLRTSDPSAKTVKCWDTYVPYTTAGAVRPKAISRYLSLDLTDSRIHTRLTTVSDTNDVLLCSETYPIPCKMKTGPGRDLFNQATNCLAHFAGHLGVRTAGLPLVFTIAFPIRQTAINAAVLHRWTKEYDCADVVGQDVVAILHECLNTAQVRIGPLLLFNDTCAEMMNGLVESPSTHIGLVVDQGSNCCYVDRASKVGGCIRSTGLGSYTIVNTEWGAFGEDGTLDFVLTDYDKSVDGRSRHPGKQIFEKLTSGKYMAELVREIVIEMTVRKVLFGGCVTPKMSTAFSLKAEHLSLVESDARQHYGAGRKVIKNVFGVANPTDFDCELFRYACRCVTRRSAHLVAAGLSSILRRLKFKTTGVPPVISKVAVGGSVFRTHPKYMSLVQCKAKLLMANNDLKFSLRMAKDNKNAIMISGLLAKINAKNEKK